MTTFKIQDTKLKYLVSVLIFACIGVNLMNENKNNQKKEKRYVYIYMQGIKTAKRESYPTFCNDLVEFPSLSQCIILLYRLLLT